MFAIGEIDVAYDVHNAAVGLFRKAFVLTAVACFHMENRDVEAFGPYDAEAAVGITQDKDCIGLESCEEFVGAIDYVAASCAKVIPHCVHIDFGSSEFEVFKKDAVQIVVVVLACVGKNYVEILAAFADYRGKTDNLRTCSHHDAEFEFAVILPMNVAIVEFWSFLFHIYAFFFGFILSPPGRNRCPAAQG